MNPQRFALLLMLGASLASAQTTTPNLLSYQGRVTDASGVLIGNSVPVNRTVTFRFYSASTGGTAVYTETQTVTISGGEFSVLLGNGTGVSGVPGPSSPASQPYKTLADIFNSTTTSAPNLFLGVTVDDGTAAVDLEISPRQQFVSGAYAFHAKVAESVVGGSVTTTMLGDAQVTNLKIAPSAIDGSRIKDLSVLTDDIAGGAITSAKIDTATVGLWTPNGTNVWRNNNVGIGESNPGFPLNFPGSLGDKISLFGNSGSHLGFGVQGGMLQIYGANSGDDITFGYGSSAAFTETMRVKGVGSVGIGTTTPLDKLHVNGGNIRITNPTNAALAIFGGTAEADLAVATNAGAWSSYAATGDAVLRSNSGKLLLQSGSGAAGLTVDTSNRVGIGTSAPSEKLTIDNGKIYLLNADNADNSGIIGTMAGSDYWWIHAAGTNNNGALYIDTGDDGTEPIIFRQAGNEKLRVNSNGYIGINNSNPGFPLQISGSVNWIGSYGYLNNSSPTGKGSTQGSAVGLYVDNRALASEFNAFSDERLKTNIVPLSAEHALRFIEAVNAVQYNWKSGTDKGDKFGFLAQDFLKAGFDNLVGVSPDPQMQAQTDASGFVSPAGARFSINYEQIIPVLTVALQELSRQAEEKDAKISALEARLSALEKLLSVGK